MSSLKNHVAKAQITKRIRSAQLGNFGDYKPVGEGVFEMRIHLGAGYRLYCTRTESITYWLLSVATNPLKNAILKWQSDFPNNSRTKSMTNFTPFDAADYLNDEETITEYLNAALEDENPNLFLVAIKDVARARGMTQLAKNTGLGRESLYKSLSDGAKPRYDTVLKIMRALNIQLVAQPLSKNVAVL